MTQGDSCASPYRRNAIRSHPLSPATEPDRWLHVQATRQETARTSLGRLRTSLGQLRTSLARPRSSERDAQASLACARPPLASPRTRQETARANLGRPRTNPRSTANEPRSLALERKGRPSEPRSRRDPRSRAPSNETEKPHERTSESRQRANVGRPRTSLARSPSSERDAQAGLARARPPLARPRANQETARTNVGRAIAKRATPNRAGAASTLASRTSARANGVSAMEITTVHTSSRRFDDEVTTARTSTLPSSRSVAQYASTEPSARTKSTRPETTFARHATSVDVPPSVERSQRRSETHIPATSRHGMLEGSCTPFDVKRDPILSSGAERAKRVEAKRDFRLTLVT